MTSQTHNSRYNDDKWTQPDFKSSIPPQVSNSTTDHQSYNHRDDNHQISQLDHNSTTYCNNHINDDDHTPHLNHKYTYIKPNNSTMQPEVQVW